MITIPGGRFPESFHRSPFWVPLAQQMAKRSRPFTDEATKYTGTSSKSKPEGKRVLACRSATSEKLTSDQCSKKKNRNPVSQARRIQARHRVTDSISQDQESRSLATKTVRFGMLLLEAEKEQRNASSSSGRNESQKPTAKASGDRLQSQEHDNVTNMLSTGVKLIPNLVMRVQENFQENNRNT